MIYRIELPLNLAYSDYSINMYNTHHIYVEQCDTDVYVKIDDPTAHRIKLKVGMKLHFATPIKQLFISSTAGTSNSKLVLISYSDMDIEL